MADYTISGIVTLPDDVTPWNGHYYLGIYSDTGIALDGDGSWRGGDNRLEIDRSTGYAEITLPETTGEERYYLRYEPFSLNSIVKGPWSFTLTADMSWGDIIAQPMPLPDYPDWLTRAENAADEAETAADQAEAAAEEIAGLLTGIGSHVGLDIDGVPYYSDTYLPDPDAIPVLADVDGVPYIVTGA